MEVLLLNYRGFTSNKKMDEVKKRFGQSVRRARKEKGWTQKELGEHFGCGQRNISDIERGVTMIDAVDMPRLARILGKDVLYFYPSVAEQLNPSLLSPGDAELVYLVRRLSCPVKERIVELVRTLGKEDGRTGGEGSC